MISLLLILIYYSMFIYSNYINGITLDVINICVFILLFILSVLFNRNIINKDFKKIKIDIKKNIKTILLLSISTAIIYSIVSIILGYFLDGMITEESVADSNLLRVFINLLLWAPITEELIFRLSLKKNINNNIIFVIISTILFAGVHVIGNGINLVTLISSLPYIVIGLYFSLLYIKTNNIVINMIMHLLINIVGVLMIISMI